MIDLAVLSKTPLAREPFDHLVVPRFLAPDSSEALERDFPVVPRAGSFPLSELAPGPSFVALVEELRGDALRRAVAEKFDLDLDGRPTLVTVRGHARAKDGRIHTDSRFKLVTVLLYMNRGWTEDGGHLRLLRSRASLDDYAVDVPPEYATAVFFRCTDDAWHGHTPHVGPRRAIQLNWVEDESWVRREQGRHRLSSKLKKWFSRA